jgi:hypothetical protein
MEKSLERERDRKSPPALSRPTGLIPVPAKLFLSKTGHEKSARP